MPNDNIEESTLEFNDLNSPVSCDKSNNATMAMEFARNSAVMVFDKTEASCVFQIMQVSFD